MVTPFEVNTAGVIDRVCTCLTVQEQRYTQVTPTSYVTYRDRSCVVHPH